MHQSKNMRSLTIKRSFIFSFHSWCCLNLFVCRRSIICDNQSYNTSNTGMSTCHFIESSCCLSDILGFCFKLHILLLPTLYHVADFTNQSHVPSENTVSQKLLIVGLTRQLSSNAARFTQSRVTNSNKRTYDWQNMGIGKRILAIEMYETYEASKRKWFILTKIFQCFGHVKLLNKSLEFLSISSSQQQVWLNLHN